MILSRLEFNSVQDISASYYLHKISFTMTHDLNFDATENRNFVGNFSPFFNLPQEHQLNTEARPVVQGPVLLTLHVVLLVMVETLGNFLLFCMISYEMYGMDPQKRTVTNQLLSKMIIVQILFNIFIMPIYVTYTIFGLPSK